MGLLYKKVMQVGDRTRYTVECDSWLAHNEVLTGVSATVDTGTAIVDGIILHHTNRAFHYFVSGGTLEDQFNVIFSQATSRGEMRYDHAEFYIETNGGWCKSSATNEELMLSIVGPTGSAGPAGPAGGTIQTQLVFMPSDPGEDGEQGFPGPQGAQGPAGPAGGTQVVFMPSDPGEDGEQGFPGPQGATGPAGPAGGTIQTQIVFMPSDPGEDGEQGFPGPQGATGPVGPAGGTIQTQIVFMPSDPGEDGEQGFQGPQGATGPAGPAGGTIQTQVVFMPSDPGEDGDQGVPGPQINGVTSFNTRSGAVALRATDIGPLDGVAINNISISTSFSAGAMTITLNDSTGAALSATNPASIGFHSGSPSLLTLTASPTITVPSTATLGFASATAGRIWVTAWNDGGTLRLGVFKASDGSNIFPLNEDVLASSTLVSAAATSAGVHYTSGAGATSKAFRIVGYIDWNASGMTAGTWTNTNLNSVVLMGYGVPTPGTVIQTVFGTGLGSGSTTSTTFVDVTGATKNITPRAACNLIRYAVVGQVVVLASGAGANSEFSTQFVRNASVLSAASSIIGVVSAAGSNMQTEGQCMYLGIDAPNSIAATTYKIQAKVTAGGATKSGTFNSGNMILDEIQV